MLILVEIVLEGLPGGLWLLWTNNNKVQLNILYTMTRFIHCQIKDDRKSANWSVPSYMVHVKPPQESYDTKLLILTV